MLKSLHWLPVEKRDDFKVLLLVYRALHDQASEYMSDMLKERAKVRTLRSTVSGQLAVPRSRLKGFGNRVFSIADPRFGMLSFLDLSRSINILVSLKNVLRQISLNMPLTR